MVWSEKVRRERKMIRCLECGEEITRLLASGIVELEVELCVDGEDIFVGDHVSGGWRCPVCNVVLFWEFEEAAQFLRCRLRYDV